MVYSKRRIFTLGIVTAALFLSFAPAIHAQQEWGNQQKTGFIKKLMEKRKQSRESYDGSDKGFFVKGRGESHKETLDGRSFIVYTPPKLPRRGRVPLLIVLHGGFGNAAHIQNYIGLDPYADKKGFVVAYLNGTRVASGLPAKFQGWNAGGCCGQPEQRKVDDIGFIASVINYLSREYGIDPDLVYGTGHSNGAMMTMRIMCETDMYRTGVGISGTLQLDRKRCPAANGKRILNIHGAQDENLPVAGGHTTAGFNKKTNYKSQEYAKALFERSGGTYDLLLLEGADHSPETINSKLWETEGVSLPEKIVKELALH